MDDGTDWKSSERSIGGKDIIIRSGYRSPKYNSQVGGAKNSQHLYGKAVDVYVKDRIISCSDLANTIYFDEAIKPSVWRVWFGSGHQCASGYSRQK